MHVFALLDAFGHVMFFFVFFAHGVFPGDAEKNVKNGMSFGLSHPSNQISSRMQVVNL